ncbi:MAG: DUF2000 domain-containing protein [Herbiconiux sp.]|nr:DUF2000 domain-containing protein [Herbiconiux sp.]
MTTTAAPGFADDEMLLSEPTRSARLKWVIVVDTALEPGLLANAVACVSAATGATIAGLAGPSAADASGHEHPGLPWSGCTVLGASAERLATVRAKAVAAEADGVWVADMPQLAQTTRVYAEYRTELAATAPDQLGSSALSIVGPRTSVDSIVKKLRLL